MARSLAALLVAALTACGGDGAKGDAAAGAAGDRLRVALLTPGPISDQAWNAGAYAGLTRIKDSLGAQVSHIQTRTPAEFEENFRQYGAQGYALAFGHGFEFQDAAQRVAPDFPKTVFVTTGGDRTGPNLAAMSFAFDEPSFLAGIVAGAISTTGIVACLGGTELPPVKASFTAFAAGARLARPDIQVRTAYIGNWDDASAGKEQALAQLRRGADVIFQNADAAGLGVFQAIKETPSAWIVGANVDQNGLAPQQALGSVLVDLPHAFLTIAREVAGGTFTGRVLRLDSTTDDVRWERNPAVAGRIPARALALVDSVEALMRAGTFVPPYGTSSADAK